MKIKIIATGSGRFERFIRRWGVSFLLGEDVLFDTFGDPQVFLKNMRKFKVDPGKVKHIILSHDHWDHISGLWYLLPGRGDITVYVCPGFRREIKERIVSSGARIAEVEPFMEIKEGIFSSGQIETSYEGRIIFEQSLAIKFLKRLTIITGCAHPGIINIMDVFKRRFEKEHIYSIMGGLHLKDNPRQINLKIVEELRASGIRKIVPMHCTGRKAVKMIRERFGRDCIMAGEGDIVDL